MAFVIADRVRETSTTTGTGSIALAGAVIGYRAFSSVLSTGDTTYYTIADQGGANWEVGIGTFTSPSTLARTTILSSSNSGSVVTFTAGTKDVFISLPASKTNTNDQPNVISVNSSSDALRITQTGAGNALLVEDSANPDATPFVVDANGNVGIGTTAPTNGLSITRDGSTQFNFTRNSDNTAPPYFVSIKRRGTDAAKIIVNNNDQSLAIQAYGYDGASDRALAEIGAFVDGIPGTNDMPGRLVFSTTADGASSPTERMRITNAGIVGIGSTGTTGATVTVAKTLTGATTAYGILSSGQVQSDVTTVNYGYLSQSNTQATAFTLGDFRHFAAVQGTIGATSAITNQHGFYVASSLTGATNNYGFYSNIASGTGRWNFYANGTADNYFGGNVGIGTTSPAYSFQVSGQVSESFSGSPTIVSKAYWTSNPADGGYFADYTCYTSNFNLLTQSKDQSAEIGGGIIDAQFVQQQDGDVVNYTSVGQKISNAVRGITTGKLTSGVFQSQYKDLVGGDFAAIGRISWSARGVSGVLGQAIQYGIGIASNEFAVQNPSGANEQSLSMAAVQAIVRAQKGASNSTYKYRGVLVQNDQGYRATSAFEAITTAGSGSLTGNFEYGLSLSGSTVETAAITMPASSTGNVGTTISYDTGDLTYYDRTNNAYFWNIGGSYVVKAESGRITNYLSGGGAAFRSLDATSYSEFYTSGGSAVLSNAGSGIIALYNGGSERMRIDSSGNVGIGTTSPASKLDVNGAIRDSKGDVRTIVQNAQTAAYVLVAADAGKHISITTGGVTVNTSIFSAGDAISIYNNSAASQTITQGTSVTMYLGGTATTGNRTLAQRGICTILCVASNTFVISGAGLS